MRPALPLSQPREACGGPQLERLGLLVPRDFERLVKAGFGAGCVVGVLGHQQLTSDAMQFGFPPAVVLLFGEAESLIERGMGFREASVRQALLSEKTIALRKLHGVPSGVLGL